MKRAELDRILKTATEDQAVKIKILHGAVVDSMKRYNADHDPKHLRAWKAAEEELDQFCTELDHGVESLPDIDTVKRLLASNLPTEAIAFLFGVSRARVRQWNAEGMPKIGRNQYRLSDCIAWYADRARGKADDAEADFRYQRARYLKAKADKATVEAGLKKRSVVPVARVAAVWSHHIATAKNKLLSLPANLAATVARVHDPARVHKESRRLIDEVLEDLAQDEPIIDDDD
jgi:phage terminase Nu1 subunit (DNA packaging protein)